MTATEVVNTFADDLRFLEFEGRAGAVSGRCVFLSTLSLAETGTIESFLVMKEKKLCCKTIRSKTKTTTRCSKTKTNNIKKRS